MNRRQKAALLTGIMNGKRSITDLVPPTFKVTLFKLDETDPNCLVEFGNDPPQVLKRITLDEYQRRPGYKVTLNL